MLGPGIGLKEAFVHLQMFPQPIGQFSHPYDISLYCCGFLLVVRCYRIYAAGSCSGCFVVHVDQPAAYIVVVLGGVDYRRCEKVIVYLCKLDFCAAWRQCCFGESEEIVRLPFTREAPPEFDAARYQVFRGSPTSTVIDGARIDLGGRVLTMLHTPGHSPGHLCRRMVRG